jgi:H+/Cl- antiporter ClcA
MDERLKALMEYTKFHIGLYTTLCTLLVGVMGLGGPKGHVTPMLPYFFWTLIFFAIAGMFGGLIGSSLPEYTTWKDFTDARLGPGFRIKDSGSLRSGSLPPSIPLFGSGPLSRCWES